MIRTQDKNKNEIRGVGNVLVQCRMYARNVTDTQHVHIGDFVGLMATWLRA